MQFGLKLGSKNANHKRDIFSLYEQGYFQYIELFAVPGSFDDTISYWKQFDIPIIIHAPHSMAGMNLSLKDHKETNRQKIQETFKFADVLNAEYIIFHSGLNGEIEETVNQLRPFADSRCLIENKPLKGLNNERCIGSTFDELSYIINELQLRFCLDFGHAICAARSLQKEPLQHIEELLCLDPAMYHLTDGDYHSEYDLHLHYGKGNFPIKELFGLIVCEGHMPKNPPSGGIVSGAAKGVCALGQMPYKNNHTPAVLRQDWLVSSDAKITNEAKHNPDSNLSDFEEDILYARRIFATG
jgi:sugar phosphate isomerase/epimerase